MAHLSLTPQHWVAESNHCSRLLVGTEHLDLGFHACTASPLPSVPSTQPDLYLFFCFYISRFFFQILCNRLNLSNTIKYNFFRNLTIFIDSIYHVEHKWHFNNIASLNKNTFFHCLASRNFLSIMLFSVQ